MVITSTRLLKTALMGLMGLWAVFGVLTNLGALQRTYDAVAGVAAMAHLGAGGTPPWATHSPFVVWCGVVLLLIGKIGTGSLCSLSALRMWLNRSTCGEQFNAAKQLGILGGWWTVFWLFLGFGFFGEIVFFMYLDSTGFQVAETAFRYVGYFGITLLYIGQKD